MSRRSVLPDVDALAQFAARGAAAQRAADELTMKFAPLDEHERAVLADLLALERHGLVKRVRGATPPLFAVTERGRLEAKR